MKIETRLELEREKDRLNKFINISYADDLKESAG